MKRQELIDKIAIAISVQEGFPVQGSLSQRNCNPGNLRSWGKTSVVNGYAKFPSPEAGWLALRSQVGKNIDRGLTLNEFFGGKPGVYAGFSPAADKNRPNEYAGFVANRVGIPADVMLNTLSA